MWDQASHVGDGTMVGVHTIELYVGFMRFPETHVGNGRRYLRTTGSNAASLSENMQDQGRIETIAIQQNTS